MQESLAKWFPFEAQVFFPVDVDTTHTGNNMFVIPTRNTYYACLSTDVIISLKICEDVQVFYLKPVTQTYFCMVR